MKLSSKKREEYRRKRALWFKSLKSQPCADCHQTFHPVVMQFDHLPGLEKKGNVSDLYRRGASKKRILEEVRKCDLVCANCHALREHYRRFESGDIDQFWD